jgi:hypothetical protein
MDKETFEAIAILRNMNGLSELDLRPFGSRQGEAIDFYLDEQISFMRNGGNAATHVVLLCHPETQISIRTVERLAELNAKGATHKIEHGW